MNQAIILGEAWQKMLLESLPLGLPLGENRIEAGTKRFNRWASDSLGP
jgi:hypothetical protein